MVGNYEHGNGPTCFIRCGEFLDLLRTGQLLMKDCAPFSQLVRPVAPVLRLFGIVVSLSRTMQDDSTSNQAKPASFHILSDSLVSKYEVHPITGHEGTEGQWKYEDRTESHEQHFFLHANWEQQTKESAVVDGTSCCVILECLLTSIACIT